MKFLERYLNEATQRELREFYKTNLGEISWWLRAYGDAGDTHMTGDKGEGDFEISPAGLKAIGEPAKNFGIIALQVYELEKIYKEHFEEMDKEREIERKEHEKKKLKKESLSEEERFQLVEVTAGDIAKGVGKAALATAKAPFQPVKTAQQVSAAAGEGTKKLIGREGGKTYSDPVSTVLQLFKPMEPSELRKRIDGYYERQKKYFKKTVREAGGNYLRVDDYLLKGQFGSLEDVFIVKNVSLENMKKMAFQLNQFCFLWAGEETKRTIKIPDPDNPEGEPIEVERYTLHAYTTSEQNLKSYSSERYWKDIVGEVVAESEKKPEKKVTSETLKYEINQILSEYMEPNHSYFLLNEEKLDFNVNEFLLNVDAMRKKDESDEEYQARMTERLQKEINKLESYKKTAGAYPENSYFLKDENSIYDVPEILRLKDLINNLYEKYGKEEVLEDFERKYRKSLKAMFEYFSTWEKDFGDDYEVREPEPKYSEEETPEEPTEEPEEETPEEETPEEDEDEESPEVETPEEETPEEDEDEESPEVEEPPEPKIVGGMLQIEEESDFPLAQIFYDTMKEINDRVRESGSYESSKDFVEEKFEELGDTIYHHFLHEFFLDYLTPLLQEDLKQSFEMFLESLLEWKEVKVKENVDIKKRKDEILLKVVYPKYEEVADAASTKKGLIQWNAIESPPLTFKEWLQYISGAETEEDPDSPDSPETADPDAPPKEIAQPDIVFKVLNERDFYNSISFMMDKLKSVDPRIFKIPALKRPEQMKQIGNVIEKAKRVFSYVLFIF